MLGTFLLTAALAMGQSAEAPRSADAADAPVSLSPAPPPALLTASAESDDKDAKGAAAPAAEPAAPAEPAPAAPPAAEASTTPVNITAPYLQIPPPPTPPAPPAATTPPDRWLLQKVYQGTGPGVWLDTNRISIYGWLEASFTLGSAGKLNLPESFNYRANEPLVQQTWLRINRSVVTSGTTEPTFGFNIDGYFGTDYRFTLARGLYNKQLTDRGGLPAVYGVDPIQFYGEAYFPTISRGLDVKVGKFYTPFGFESVEAPSTPLMSRSYTFANAPPFTHVGVLLTQNLPNNWIVQAGLVNGEDIMPDTADEPTFIGTVQYTQPGNRNIYKFSAIIDSAWFNQNDGFSGIAGNPNYHVYDFVWTHNFDSTPRLSYDLECIFGFINNFPDALARNGVDNIHIGSANWWGIVNYMQYTFSPTLVGTARFEVFDDPQGVRTNTFPSTAPDINRGLYTALTLGVNFKPRRQPSGNGIIMFRPEIRYDYNWDSKPFGNIHHGLATAGSDLILRW